MTEQQFNILADLLGLSHTDRAAAYGVVIGGNESDLGSKQHVKALRQADAAIRAAYVIHSPMEFRITVGHRDTHRAPGALKLNIGDSVRLVAQSTERWIPVRVTALPDTACGYYRGVITEQLVKTSKFQVGNGVRFSEDQVMCPARDPLSLRQNLPRTRRSAKKQTPTRKK